ncbi:uncharacterized protein LOC113465423 [Diaphorina citri]|uniref:Uncharacterized protein LOC113465423 n=1 Tax=Diaphorina citri TaxID=121845 RepID=A0A3Q0IHR5_DIACI|nr:uncharacterized protein LOC113465423 [Diaphorina citri]
MAETPRPHGHLSLRSRTNSTSCFPLNLTHDLVYDFALRFDTQIKKCLDTCDHQDISDLIPIIVQTLSSLDDHINDLTECRKKKDALQEKVKTQSAANKQIKEELKIERHAHQDTILQGDTHILELTEEKRVMEEECKTLKQNISIEKSNIQTLNKRICDLSSETARTTIENNNLKESIITLRSRLNVLEEKLKEKSISDIQQIGPKTSLLKRSFVTHPKTIHILGDSNVRGLGATVTQRCSNKLRFLTSCVPGGGLCQINQAAFISQPVPGDLIILHAGTNDICQTDWTTIKQSLESFIARYSHCSIVVFTVPPRYDLPHLNKHINRFNTLLKYAVRDASNVKLIITKRLISPKLFKADGLHYNDQGKDKMARKILSLLQDIPTVPDSPPSFSQLNRHHDDDDDDHDSSTSSFFLM